MSQQSRSNDALAAAAHELTAAARAARNIVRLRGNQAQPPRDPMNLDQLIEALVQVHTITGALGKTVMHYAHAVRSPLAGYGEGEGPGDYSRSVDAAAADAAQALTALAKQLAYHAPIGPSTDAIASLDIAVHKWRTKTANRA